MQKFKMEMRRDGSYHEPAEEFCFDEVEINIYDSPDPRTLAASKREGKFYGAVRTVHLVVTWEDEGPCVVVNGKRVGIEV